eukprot:578668-Pelagomonas_calceolata.AAC.5
MMKVGGPQWVVGYGDLVVKRRGSRGGQLGMRAPTFRFQTLVLRRPGLPEEIKLVSCKLGRTYAESM